ncbi:MAG: flagellar type III secretion system pore protein FliP [bacterium]
MIKKGIVIILIIFALLSITSISAYANEFQLPNINLEIDSNSGAESEEGDLVLSLRILLGLTILSLAPAILILVTSFTRIVIVLSLVRQALATQTMPPSQVIIGLAIFLTIFIMAPVWQSVNVDAIQPYINQEISMEEAYNNGIEPIREFMFKQTREKDIGLFFNISNLKRPQEKNDVPTYILVPAFVISELKTAFQIGFMIYLPFLMIDMVVASILMSMGMLMLPPVMISMPFKLLLFVLADGWYLVIESLVRTFN